MKIVYIDLDGVLANFIKAARERILLKPVVKYPQSEFGFFFDLEPIEGGIDAVKKLSEKYDVYILSRPSPLNLNCYTEKAAWVRKYLGYDMQEKLILSCDKSLIKGDYLIDDDTNAKQELFEGEFIKFGGEKFKDWETVLKYLL
jgi:5'-nucleotidase